MLIATKDTSEPVRVAMLNTRWPIALSKLESRYRLGWGKDPLNIIWQQSYDAVHNNTFIWRGWLKIQLVRRRHVCL